jgi:predicted DNA-binding transcriptional regulator AlpA
MENTFLFGLCSFLFKQGGTMDPQEILDRTETCQMLGISRQTLLSWIRKGKLKVWKRVGAGSNAALLFDRNDIQAQCGNRSGLQAQGSATSNGNGHDAVSSAA